MDRIQPFDSATQSVVYGDNDLWKNGNPSQGQEGSIPPEESLRHPQEEIVHAIEQAGLTPDHEDLTQLWQAMLSLLPGQLSLTYPEVETADGKLILGYNGDGTSTLSTGQTWIWRGAKRFSTDSFDVADRTVSHVANKVYHVRWHAPGTGDATPIETYPFGRFVLKDTTDVGYNPGALAEADPTFDCTYDDMLIALVTTDGANVPTIFQLINRAVLFASGEAAVSFYALQDDIPPSQITNGPSVATDFSRIAQASLSGFSDVTASAPSADVDPGSEINIGVIVPNRYFVRLFYQRTINAGSGYVSFRAWA